MKKRTKKYTEKVGCAITGTMKRSLRKIKREKKTTYAALLRDALNKVYGC